MRQHNQARKRRSKSLKKKTRAFFAVEALLLQLFFFGCGLPTTSFLAPPILPGTSSDGAVTYRTLYFAHNGANDIDDFEGYDLWYKLYVASPAGEELLRTDESHIEATPRQPGSGRLQARGFRRAVTLRRDDEGNLLRFDDTRPTITMSPTSTSILFQLDLRPPFARDPRVSKDTAEITVVRYGTGILEAALRRRNVSADTVTEPTGEGGFFTFWDNDRYRSGQSDVYSALLQNFNTAFPGDVIIVIYAITVGLDRSQSSFSRFYSEPLRLDPAQITFSGS